MNYKSQRGFSLVELMIVVVIVAILSAIALPLYNKQVRTSKRSDGINKLEQIAQNQEKLYNANNVYTDPGAQASDEGHYQVEVIISNSGQKFEASAVAQGDQANDTGCTTITLDSTGKYTPASCVKQ